jgi:hypothetical protein
MQRFLHIIVVLFAGFCLHAQESIDLSESFKNVIIPTEKKVFYKIAQSTFTLKIQQYGDNTDYVFINLHDDEETSVIAAKRILQEYGGLLIEVENKLQRNLRFQLGNYYYRVDPNRIFSSEGIKKSMEQLGRSSLKAVTEVEKFGQYIISQLPENAACIIALHNNTPGLFSASDYAAGNNRTTESKKVYLNPDQDTDDFFLTTDSKLYEQLADKGFNTILQDNKNCTEDGSLSVYFGKRNIRYVNCETEHGKTEQYLEMMKSLLDILKKESR